MQVCDFPNSYFTWCVDLDQKMSGTITHIPPHPKNMARVPIEARCRITDPGGESTDYTLGANCKTEKVGVDRDIWILPNADFNPIYSSKEEFLIIKYFQKNDLHIEHEIKKGASQLERQTGEASDAWTWHRLDLAMTEGRELSVKEIVGAVLNNRRLVVQTEYDTPSGHHVWLEYPAKTTNVNDDVPYYQVDTGPVPFPLDLDAVSNPLESFHLAFVAHWMSDWAEFVVNVPTDVGEGVTVNHYSKSVRVEGTVNRLLEVGTNE
jgi:hypothetical protein